MDRPRTLAYKTAVETQSIATRGKVSKPCQCRELGCSCHVTECDGPVFSLQVVMDIGCGSGILSLFCARLGEAKKVNP